MSTFAEIENAADLLSGEANKFPHIRRVNALLGGETPQRVTPRELLSPDE